MSASHPPPVASPPQNSGVLPERSPHKSKDIKEWLGTFFTINIAISTIGAGFTFPIIFTDLHPPSNSSAETVRERLVICWLLFIANIVLAGGFAVYIALEPGCGGECQIKSCGVWWCILAYLLQVLLAGAFMAAALAIAAFSGTIGWIIVGLTGYACALLVMIWVWIYKAVSL